MLGKARVHGDPSGGLGMDALESWLRLPRSKDPRRRTQETGMGPRLGTQELARTRVRARG